MLAAALGVLALLAGRDWGDALTPAAAEADAAAPLAEPLRVRVVNVLDGDSLRVTHGDRELEVRLHGIDAPEYGQPGSAAARAALRKLTGGGTLTLTPVTIDRFGRTVGELHRDGEHLNRTLVAEGHAWVFRRFAEDPALLRAEAQARAAGRGLWSEPAPLPPWEWRDRQETAATKPLRSDPSASCLIKGNVSSRGERIYHVPGQEYYEATRISPRKGERWFCSEAEARAAGWRRARD